jgi:hypothetical protein
MMEVVDLKDRTREKKINKETKIKNWVYYMQQGLKYMWKSKEVPDYRKESYKDVEKRWRQDDASELLDEIDPHYVKREKNWSQRKHEEKVFGRKE